MKNYNPVALQLLPKLPDIFGTEVERTTTTNCGEGWWLGLVQAC